ncbi:helicase-related protein [Exiguobacterium sp. s39]|uniref:helicase-related protein n=1 Tax=Exiguobacterium sp. s39 TaxID=2751198 RepID=UPI001BE78111|nr:helicase-related protein [Exiguobacterium sp. s39]
MNNILKKSLMNRESIINAIEQEIVGPGDINNCEKLLNVTEKINFNSYNELNINYYWNTATLKEEILQREPPSRRYAAGMLYPKAIMDSESELEELLSDTIYGIETETILNQIDEVDREEVYDSSEYVSALSELRQRDSIPSSMGITFCLSKKTNTFKIQFEGGIYEKRKIYKDIEKTSTKEDWWFRTSIYASKEIKLSDFTDNKEGIVKVFALQVYDKENSRIDKIKLDVHIQLRYKEEFSLLTVTILNTTKIPSNGNLDEFTVFQSCLKIINEDVGFLNYPKNLQRNLELSKDEWNNELLFKNKVNYAFGHGCSVFWNQHQSNIVEIKSTFIPRYETESMTPDINLNVNGINKNLKIEMKMLMDVQNHEELSDILIPMIKGYEEWIKTREKEIQSLRVELKEAAIKNLELCTESLNRIQKGLLLLKKPKVLKAFKMANRAILLQQINGKTHRNAYYNKTEHGINLVFEKTFSEVINKNNLNSYDNSWRAFQIAFFLLSIQSLVEKESFDRETIDLIWFPTGGGKTEAYLGVAAFQMFYRRLLDSNDVGVDIMMRYTLRLLTADQFQRASRLICSMEYIRRDYSDELGDTPYSIGIWVGSSTSPNNNKEALRKLNEMSKSKGSDNLIVTKCPWCGCQIGKVDIKDKKTRQKDNKVIGFKNKNDQLLVACPDSECDFHEEIPVYFVDETIYEKKPTFLIGTIDKFVQLSWKPDARTLFGINKQGMRIVSPPQIIIQDELHLISGPLGTLAGLYEVLIEELCIDDRGKVPIKPKIISATATIKEFEEQAKCLFGRESSRLFPSPGIDIDDSFFSKVAVDELGTNLPGRKYIGVFTSKVKVLMAQVMTYSAILQNVENFQEDERDPYWTLLSFYNSLRDLGAGLSLFNSDIPTYIDSVFKRERLKSKRFLNTPLELTSRKQSNEISKTIDDLNISYDTKDNKNRTKALTSCLASNIIEVGIDIDRLSLMGIVGQPKQTAQYIQVSGRVGRKPQERPGLIVTVYSNQNSRDKSHFEHFNEYHQRLYAQVETTSLTPFSTSSLERGLTAVIIGFIRQRIDMQVSTYPTNENIKKVINDEIFKSFQKRFNDRIKLIDPTQLSIFRNNFKIFIDRLLQNRYESWMVSDTSRGLMYQAGNLIDGEKYYESIPVINSLRSVDAESRGSIVLFKEEDEFTWEDDE